MATEKEKMLSSELYNAADTELTAERLRARQLLKQLNDSLPDSLEFSVQLLTKLIPI